MRFYVNECSLRHQYATPAEFAGVLESLIASKGRGQAFGVRIFCSRDISFRPVTPQHNFQQAIQCSGNKDFMRSVLGWLNKHGPFWEEDREFNQDDYFECRGIDVTDSSLGEAARSKANGFSSCLLSFREGGFDYAPVVVQHGISEEVLGEVSVDNIWVFDSISQVLVENTPRPSSWGQMIEQARNRFEHIYYAEGAVDALVSEPFSSCVVDRFFELSKVLDEYVWCLGEGEKKRARADEILIQHFGGEKAWFSDESDTNKNKHAEAMRFKDPDTGEKISCTWHGKVKTPQYRLHFKWPVEGGGKLQVLYFGPKLTKD